MKKADKLMLFLFSLGAMTFLMRCANLGDSSEDLGGGYSYRLDGSDSWINTDHTMKKKVYPNIVKYASNRDFIIIIQSPSIKGYGRLLSQDIRYQYYYAMEHLNNLQIDNNEKRFLNSHLWKDENIHKRVAKEIKPDNLASFEKLSLIADSIIKYDPEFKKDFIRKENYWIIKKKEDLVLGPFSKQEYLDIRSKLKVPRDLEFKE